MRDARRDLSHTTGNSPFVTRILGHRAIPGSQMEVRSIPEIGPRGIGGNYGTHVNFSPFVSPTAFGAKKPGSRDQYWP